MSKNIIFSPVDAIVKELLSEKLKKIENYLDSDVFTYWGPIRNGIEVTVKKIIEDLSSNPVSAPRKKN